MNNSFDQKYRPIQLSDMIGQERIIKAITKQAEQDKFGHAYLFAGHFGAGKTTSARLLATLMTCENKKNQTRPCTTCPSCIAIHNGQSPDVIEIDAASNRGIDDVREIKKDAYVAPHVLRKKIYILDEAHKLSPDAWNALLKVLEEPPSFVAFIFCTTEAKKVPAPIRSRCRSYLFTPIPATAIASRLLQVAKKENFVLEEAAAQDLGRLSSGSLRNGLIMLEDMSIVTEGKVTMQAIHDHFGVPERRLIYNIINLIGNQDVVGVFETVDNLLIAGADVRTIAMEISEAFRLATLISTCGKNSPLVDITTEEKELLQTFVNKVNRTGLVGIAKSFGKIDREIELNINSRWILEAALLSCITNVGTEAGKVKI